MTEKRKGDLTKLLGILAAALIALIGFVGSSMHSDINALKEGKLDKEQYRCDLARVEGKIDKLIGFHMGDKK